VPPPYQCHGDAYFRPDRLLCGAVRAHRPRPGRHLSQVSVRPARSRRDLKSFIDLPYQLFAGVRLGSATPPRHRDDVLRRRTLLQHAERYFLAERNGRIVGRIAAIENRLHNETHGDRVGFFGWFDCVDDQDVANALFATVESWLRERKLHVMRGPASFSTNDQCGLLVDGFGTRPTLLMPHNPPYYVTLTERAGFTKAKDLFVYQGGDAEEYPVRSGLRAVPS
jgi:hypothetical protein